MYWFCMYLDSSEDHSDDKGISNVQISVDIKHSVYIIFSFICQWHFISFIKQIPHLSGKKLRVERGYNIWHEGVYA